MIDLRLGRRAVLRGMLTVCGGAAVGLASPRLALAQAKPRPVPHLHTIVLDAGHGGIDPGAIGLSGAYEKDIAFDVTSLVARSLEATKRYRVVLTRTSDEFVPLHERVQRGRGAGGELFLSIHADALPDPAMRGASVFTLSEKASDAEAASLAASENKADLIAGIDLSRHAPEVSTILIDLARRQTNNLSIRLARQLVAELGHDVTMLNNSHRSAGFAVLKAPDVPSALVELGALSNREEERALRTPAYRQKMATSLVRSVNDYFDTVIKA